MTEFTREDVVKHLADLGYDNVEEAKLDSFCADLRRLIKYEEKKRRVGEKLEQLEQSQRRLQESREDSKDSSTTPEVARRKRRVRREDKQRAKEEKLKAKYGGSEDSTNSSNLRGRDGVSSSVRGEVETSIEREEVDYNMTGHDTSVSSEAHQDDPSSLYIDVDLPPSRPSSSSLPLAASLLSQPPPGFIRVRSGPSVGRKGPASDSVALHQRYRDQWARSNIPGEKRHDRLRWAVRGWMMGEEPV